MLAFRCVGLLYLLSGMWCALRPQLAAEFLGFTLNSPLGLAEFFSVYGGLQCGIALAILITSFIPSYRIASSFFALIVSLGLFAFRSVSALLIDQSAPLLFMLCLEGGLVLLLLVVWRQQVRSALTCS